MDSICSCFCRHRRGKVEFNKDIEDDSPKHQVNMSSFARNDGIDKPISSEGSLSKESLRLDTSKDSLCIISEYQKLSEIAAFSKEFQGSDDSLGERDGESLSPISIDLVKNDFKEALVLDSDVEADMKEDETSQVRNVIAPVDDEDRLHRISLLKELFVENLYNEKARFMSVFQKKTASVAAYIDSEISELYLFLQKIVRDHHLLRKANYSPSMSNICLELVENITDRIFFSMDRVRCMHKGLLNKAITNNDFCINKMYNDRHLRIEEHMTRIADEKNDDSLIEMEIDPYDSYQRLFGIFLCYQIPVHIEHIYIQPAVDCLNEDLDVLRTLAQTHIDKARDMLSGHINKVSRVISRPSLLNILDYGYKG